MPSFSVAMEQALSEAKLTLREFCELAGFSQQEVRSWTSGTTPTGAQLERCALVFGVGVEDLLAGAAPGGIMTLLFKRNRGPATSAAHAQLVDLETNLGPNRFCRTVAALSRLNGLLGLPSSSLPQLTPRAQQGDALAAEARQALGLDPKAPIASMRALLRQLRVEVIVAGTDEIDRRINGASTSTPVPAVLVARAANEPRVIRMTLAHELAHLMCHGGAFVLSPGALTNLHGWELELDFASREQQADAFAAAFLAPRFAVQDLLQQRNLAPETTEAVRAVGSHFGVGREVAVNRIVDTMGLSERARARLMALPVSWKREFNEDTFQDSEVGLQGGVLRERVLEAASRHLIDEMTARAMLSLPGGVTLDGQPESAEKALRRIARQIQVLLLGLGWRGVPVDVSRSSTGWTARLVDMKGESLGRVELDEDEQELRRLGA